MGAAEWGSLLGLFAVALATAISPIIFRICERRQEKNSLKKALKKEVLVLKKLIESRDYIGLLESKRDYIDDLITGIPREKENKYPKARIKSDFFLVYRNNSNKLGLLDDDLVDYLVNFYSNLMAVAEDFNAAYEGAFDNSEPETILKALEDDIALLREALSLSKKIEKF